MRLFTLLLTVILLTGTARAQGGAFDFGATRSVQHRKRVGIALLATGLTVAATGLAVMLAGAPPRNIDPYHDYGPNETLGPDVSLIISGGSVTALGLVFVGLGAPLLGVANADAKRPPSLQTLQRRKAGGYTLIGLGLAMQVVGTVVAVMYAGKIFEYNPPDLQKETACGAGASLGVAGVAVMAAGIPLASTASRDVKLRAGLGSLALSF